MEVNIWVYRLVKLFFIAIFISSYIDARNIEKQFKIIYYQQANINLWGSREVENNNYMNPQIITSTAKTIVGLQQDMYTAYNPTPLWRRLAPRRKIPNIGEIYTRFKF
jgi:hypothetical protein